MPSLAVACHEGTTHRHPLDVHQPQGHQPRPSGPTLSLATRVIDYYSKKGLVANLHAEKSPKEVTAEVQKALS
ncbi:hypothetical protein PR202_gb00177 [Eleusine coracana subsp. coracana]|uniref:Uncharacterized protein n=1 Tax=Eleusine coracana subsp. coracana TaxID=191504 RepID=A0AAV5DR85_ELECO|nr:hypothetical protein PR202_gb00177 [Eleusine coracana subsp. coracana]